MQSARYESRTATRTVMPDAIRRYESRTATRTVMPDAIRRYESLWQNQSLGMNHPPVLTYMNG